MEVQTPLWDLMSSFGDYLTFEDDLETPIEEKESGENSCKKMLLVKILYPMKKSHINRMFKKQSYD